MKIFTSKKMFWLLLAIFLLASPALASAATTSSAALKKMMAPKSAAAKPKSNVKSVLNSRFTEPKPTAKVVTTKSKSSAVKKSTAPMATKKNLSFQQAYKVYRTTNYRLQFSGCHGSPGTLVMKKGAELMLDNRDGRARRIAIGSDQFIVPAYDFLIITPRVTGTNYVTCDGGGAARLIVQP